MKKFLALLMFVCMLFGSLAAAEAIQCTHNWTDWAVKKAATCTAKGEEVRICTLCALLESREIPATDHVWNEGTVVKEATCGEDGVKEYVCLQCKAKGKKVLPKTGKHTVVSVAAKAATCTEDGNTAGTKCSVCGTVLSGLEVIPATGHTERIVAGFAPTWDYIGMTDGIVCTTCGEVIQEQEVIPPLSSYPSEPELEDIVLDLNLTDGVNPQAKKSLKIEDGQSELVLTPNANPASPLPKKEDDSVTVSLSTMTTALIMDIPIITVKSTTSDSCVKFDLHRMINRDKTLDIRDVETEIRDITPDAAAKEALKDYTLRDGAVRVDVTMGDGSNEKLLLGHVTIHLFADKGEDTQVVFVNKYDQVLVTEAKWIEAKGDTPAHWSVPWLGNGVYVAVDPIAST